MDKKDLEDLKKRLENAEFNNYEEDMRVSDEESSTKYRPKHSNNEDDFKNNNDDNNKKNAIIIGLVICVVILLLIVGFFLTKGNGDNNTSNNSGDNNSSENKESNSENGEKGNNEQKEDTDINKDDYDYSSGKIYFNKYIYITSKDKSKKVISTLEGKILLKSDSSLRIFEESDKSLYIVDLKYQDTGVLNIKRIKDNLVSDVFNDKANGLLLGNEKENLIGAFKQDTNNDIIYLIDGDNVNTVKLDNYGAYIANNSSKDNKYIYNNRYMIIFDKMNQESFENYGVYDIKNKTQVIKGTYDGIEYLHNDLFVAIKNDKSGIVDTNNKKLIELNNELIVYSNGLFFIGNNNKLQVYDSKFNKLDKQIDVPNLSKFTYSPCCGAINPFDLIPYKNYVVVRIGYLPNSTSNYIVLDQSGKSTDIGKGYIGFVGDYLVKSNEDDSFISMYDSSLSVKHKIDVGTKALKIDNMYTFLNNTLVINGSKLYNLTNDSSKGTTSWYRRTSQEFDVKLDFKGETGTVTVSRHDQEIDKVENVSVNDFLAADNNGITITKEYFIYNADGISVIQRNEEDVKAQQ